MIIKTKLIITVDIRADKKDLQVVESTVQREAFDIIREHLNDKVKKACPDIDLNIMLESQFIKP